jgi:transcriptional regulator with XRE-family HTH domain
VRADALKFVGPIPNGPLRVLTMTAMSAEDLGKRIAAARAYRGMELASLADAINVTPAVLQRLETGLEDLDEGAEWALLEVVAGATRLPTQFFTVDFQALPNEGAPTSRLERLEQKVDEALERMDGVVREADGQMTRGKDQLDRFIETMGPDRDLLQKIARRLDIPT